MTHAAVSVDILQGIQNCSGYFVGKCLHRQGQHTEGEQSECLQDEVIVTRAPGRLDVMGGIGDYSGCLVLQKPTAEACHVACQRHPLAKQKVWKHIENRHKGHSKLPPPSNPVGSPTSCCHAYNLVINNNSNNDNDNKNNDNHEQL